MKLNKNSVNRVLRGGSCGSATLFLRCSESLRLAPMFRFRFSGFRFVVRGKK
jgi:formylglycine-generating enzyme required for sulfatase activity